MRVGLNQVSSRTSHNLQLVHCLNLELCVCDLPSCSLFCVELNLSQSVYSLSSALLLQNGGDYPT